MLEITFSVAASVVFFALSSVLLMVWIDVHFESRVQAFWMLRGVDAEKGTLQKRQVLQHTAAAAPCTNAFYSAESSHDAVASFAADPYVHRNANEVSMDEDDAARISRLFSLERNTDASFYSDACAVFRPTISSYQISAADCILPPFAYASTDSTAENGVEVSLPADLRNPSASGRFNVARRLSECFYRRTPPAEMAVAFEDRSGLHESPATVTALWTPRPQQMATLALCDDVADAAVSRTSPLQEPITFECIPELESGDSR